MDAIVQELAQTAFSWLIKPEKYQKRHEVTNIMKKFYTEKEHITKFKNTFNKFTDHVLSKCFSNDQNKYIENAEKCIINCLKFDELDGFQGLFLYIFFLHPKCIGKFWLFAICGEPLILQTPQLNGNQDFQNPNQSYQPNQNPSYKSSQSSLYQPPQNPSFQTNQPFYSSISMQQQPPPQFNQNHQFYSPQQRQPYYGNQNSSTFNQIPNYISSENQIKAENPDKFVDALCNVIKYACTFPSESREFINYFLSRFLVKGLKVAAEKLCSSRFVKINEQVQKFIMHITSCGCDICYKPFKRCCKAYNSIFQASLSINDNQLHYDILHFILYLLNDIVNENVLSNDYLSCLLEQLIVKIKPIYFDSKIQNILSIILNIGLELTYNITNPQPKIMKSCLDIIGNFFNMEKLYYFIDDSDLVTDCIRFFYLNRFYEPFRGITQQISNKELKSKINLEKLDDIISDALAEEEENENEIENETMSDTMKDKEYKEYVRFFNDLRGKGKKKKNEPLIDAKSVDENIKAGIDRAFQMNINDIIIIAPIAASCQESFQAFYDDQFFEDLEADQNQSQNSLFLESNFTHKQDQE